MRRNVGFTDLIPKVAPRTFDSQRQLVTFELYLLEEGYLRQDFQTPRTQNRASYTGMGIEKGRGHSFGW